MLPSAVVEFNDKHVLAWVIFLLVGRGICRLRWRLRYKVVITMFQQIELLQLVYRLKDW